MSEHQLAIPSADPICSLMEKVVAAGITADSVEVLERMMAMHERNQTKQAEQEFARAFAELQKELPKIQATRAVPNKDGTERYRFAPFEEIMRQAQPFLSAHGFAVSFNTKWEQARIIVSCTLLHSGGHSKTNDFAARVGSGPPGANEAQADMAVKTLAKRGALCDALNIVVEHDTDGDDARSEGAQISAAEVEQIRSLIKETKADERRLLEWAGAKTVEEIRSSRYQDVIQALEKRRKKSVVEEPKHTDPDAKW